MLVCANAEYPMDLTLLGIIMLFKFEQFLNANHPIFVIVLGRDTLFIDDEANASSEIQVTVYPSIADGIVMLSSIPMKPVITAWLFSILYVNCGLGLLSSGVGVSCSVEEESC